MTYEKTPGTGDGENRYLGSDCLTNVLPLTPPLFGGEVIYRDVLLLAFNMWRLREAESSQSKWRCKLPSPPHLAITLVKLLAYGRFVKLSLCRSHLKGAMKRRESFEL